jgi:O-antigen ligase
VLAGPPAEPAALLDAATRWVLRAGAVALPLAVWPAGYDVFVLPKLVVLRLLVVSLAALHLAAWASGQRGRAGTPLDWPLAAFVGSAAVAAAFAVNRDVAVFGTYYRYEGLLTIACYALLFRLAAPAIDGREAWRLVRSLLAGGYLVSLLAIVQWAVAGAAVGSGASESARTFGGAFRASSTFGNADVLGVYLALLMPLALHELLRARGLAERLLSGNVAAVLGLALLFTYCRAAWVGAALGVALVAAAPAVRTARRWPRTTGAGALAAVAGLGLVVAAGATPPGVTGLLARAATTVDPASGSTSIRIHMWHDSLSLIAARPWTGWGPDTFGLVFPRFATGRWPANVVVDKAHNDLLQVAATQGLPGLAAHLALLAVVAAAFWRGRRRPGALALLAAWLAYEVSLQATFSWLPAAAPAWLLLAAAIAVWRPDPVPASVPGRWRRSPVAVPALAAAVVVSALIVPAILPLAGDTAFRAALAARAEGNRTQALRALATARRLAPEQGAYAAVAGDVLLDVDPTGAPGPRAEPAAARVAYLDAVRLGDTRPGLARNLATAERLLAGGPAPHPPPA